MVALYRLMTFSDRNRHSTIVDGRQINMLINFRMVLLYIDLAEGKRCVLNSNSSLTVSGKSADDISSGRMSFPVCDFVQRLKSHDERK
jgi:hypothetical protein